MAHHKRKCPRYSIEWPDGMEPTPSCLANYLKDSCVYYWNNKDRLRKELLSGFTVSIMQVPESVAFSFVAGVGPLYGLYATFFLGFLTAALGGAPGMISGAAGALAVVARDITAADGPLSHLTHPERVEYLLIAMFFAGLFQMAVGALGLAKLVKLIPESAMLGFVNGLAIVIFMAQLGAFKRCTEEVEFFEECPDDQQVYMKLDEGEVWMVIIIIAITMFVVHFWDKIPKIGPLVPGSLMALVAGTFFEHVINRMAIGWNTRTVQETAPLSGAPPPAHWPDVDWSNTNDMSVAVQYGISLGAIGLIESVMTLQVVYEITLHPQSTFRANQECIAQGFANFMSSLFSAMGGDAMIGQSTINVINGARGRLSGMAAGWFLLIIIVALHHVIKIIPIASLTGVLFMVVIHTFNWKTFEILYRGSWKDGLVIILVTALAVIFDLAIAVAAGVVVTSLFSSWQSGKLLHAKSVIQEDESGKQVKRYFIQGPVFFGSTRSFLDVFSPATDPEKIIINFSDARICDFTAVAAIRSIAIQYKHIDKEVKLEAVSEKSFYRLERTKKYVTDHISLDNIQDDRQTPLEGEVGHVAIVPAMQNDADRNGPTTIELEGRNRESPIDISPREHEGDQREQPEQRVTETFHELPMFAPVSAVQHDGEADEFRDLKPQDEGSDTNSDEI